MARTIEAELLKPATPHEFLILTPVPKAICTKQIKKNKTISHRVAKNFKFHVHQFDTPDDFFKIMEKLQKKPYSFIVRGHPTKTVDMQCDVRRIVRGTGEGTIIPAMRRWVTLDIDGIPADKESKLLPHAFDLKDPEATIIDIIDLLPMAFQGVSCHWRYSASTGFKGSTVSCHLSFVLDVPVEDEDLRRYFQTFNESFISVYGRRLIDPALFNPIQPHYTAAPIIEQEDPLSQRSGVLHMGSDIVTFSKEWVISNEGEDEDRKYMRFFNRIGDDKDGFHHPIMQGVASWINFHGEPEAAARSEIKRLVRSYVADAEVSKDRKLAETDRYGSDNFLDTLIDGAINKGFARGTKTKIDISELLSTYIYVSYEEIFYHPNKDLCFPPSAIKNMHASMAPNKSISKLLLESSDLKMVDTLEFVPGVEENMSMHHGRKIYNTWTPRKIIPSSDAIDVKIFTDHLKFLVDNDKAAHHHLCSCIAHVLAHPGRRLRHAVILGSRREGTGKSYLKSVFRGIIGQEHVMEIGTDQLKEQFNEWLQRSEIIFVEELMAGGRLDIVNRLKPMLSEDTIAIRKMRTDSYTAINPASFFCTTNHRDAVILDRDSRRFWVWFSDAAPKSAAYYKKLFKWSDENLSSIYRWAIEYDLKDFNPEAPPPKTKHFNEMVDQTAKPIQSYIFEQIVSEDWPFKCDLVTTSDLAMSIKEIPGMRGISTVKLGTTLKSIGCLSLGQKRLADGTKPRLWAVRNYEKWANASEKEISTTYRPPGRYNDKNLDF